MSCILKYIVLYLFEVRHQTIAGKNHRDTDTNRIFSVTLFHSAINIELTMCNATEPQVRPSIVLVFARHTCVYYKPVTHFKQRRQVRYEHLSE